MTRWCLVVEDESPLGEMICDNLGVEGYGVELVRDGLEALERMSRGGIDLVLLDVMLPGCSGFEVLEKMRGRGDQTPVLVLSARSSDDDRIRGLELQADDYLPKPFNLKELLLRVAALLRRGAPSVAGADTVCFGGNSIDFRSGVAMDRNGDEHSLTKSELGVLRLLVGRANTIVPRREVVDLVLGRQTPVTTRTLDNVMAKLRKVFELDPQQPRHLKTIRGVGWRYEPD